MMPFGKRLIEPCFVPDTLVTGLADYQDAGPFIRLVFYSELQTFDGGLRPALSNVVCARLVIPAPQMRVILCDLTQPGERRWLPMGAH